MADADLTERLRAFDQLPNEIFRRGVGKFAVEGDHQQMLDAEFADERDLMLGGGEESRRLLGPEHLRGMRIERDDHWRSASSCAWRAEVEMTA